MGNLQKRLVIITVLVLGILGYSIHSFWQKTSASEELLNETATSAPNTRSDLGQPKESSEIAIYVSGAVNKPGVYKMIKGNRVIDAINAAGGFSPGADNSNINLALHVKDEMQVNVPYMPVAAVNVPGAAVSNASSASGKVNINTASMAELDKLPGIGPALADRIVEHRNANGPFADTADLKKVPGIGESKYNQLKDKISI